MSSNMTDNWKHLRLAADGAGVSLEYIPWDDQPYEVFIIFPDSRRRIAKGKNEKETMMEAVDFLTRLTE